MSRAFGMIKFKDDTIRYYEYNGTIDMVIKHYKTHEDLSENWRSHKTVQCKCGGKEPVSIFSYYDSGFYFDGLASKACASVRTIEWDFDTNSRDETEDWVLELGW